MNVCIQTCMLNQRNIFFSQGTTIYMYCTQPCSILLFKYNFHEMDIHYMKTKNRQNDMYSGSDYIWYIQLDKYNTCLRLTSQVKEFELSIMIIVGNIRSRDKRGMVLILTIYDINTVWYYYCSSLAR